VISPWCDFTGPARALHAHFGDAHADAVRTEEQGGRFFYAVTCPRCGAEYRHVMRKTARSPEFLAEFDQEIRMVALDMLVHHLVAEHEAQETGV
jgi:hypothetical protein